MGRLIDKNEVAKLGDYLPIREAAKRIHNSQKYGNTMEFIETRTPHYDTKVASDVEAPDAHKRALIGGPLMFNSTLRRRRIPVKPKPMGEVKLREILERAVGVPYIPPFRAAEEMKILADLARQCMKDVRLLATEINDLRAENKALKQYNAKLQGNSSPQGVPDEISDLSDRLIEQYAPHPVPPCVYFLIDNGSVAYVGQSFGLCRRLAVHREEGKEFDRVLYMTVDADQIDEIENKYIRKLNARYNGTRPNVRAWV